MPVIQCFMSKVASAEHAAAPDEARRLAYRSVLRAGHTLQVSSSAGFAGERPAVGREDILPRAASGQLPTGRAGHSAVQVRVHLYVIGGSGPNGQVLPEVLSTAFDAGRPLLAGARHGAVLARSLDRLVVGGNRCGRLDQRRSNRAFAVPPSTATNASSPSPCAAIFFTSRSQA